VHVGYRPTLLQRWCHLSQRVSRRDVCSSRPITAGWLAAAARSAATVTCQACCKLTGPCVFHKLGRRPKRAGCSSSMQLPRANQATKSSCSGPTGRNSLYDIYSLYLDTKVE